MDEGEEGWGEGAEGGERDARAWDEVRVVARGDGPEVEGEVAEEDGEEARADEGGVGRGD